MARPTQVSAQMQLRLVVTAGACLPVSATLSYDRADPYAVSVAFRTAAADGDERAGADGTETVLWTFARSLLAEGLTRLSGIGDVRVWPGASDGEPVVCLSLSSPSGTALFELPLQPLADFLAATFAAVPSGAESDLVDVDAELGPLLWAEPGT